MELGLSLGDAPSKTTTTGVDKTTLGFCMALGITTTHDQQKEKPQSNDDDEFDDDDDDDDDEHEKDDANTLKEKGGIINTVSHERLLVSSSSNPPVQLDLLPSGPVHRHTSFPWSPDNGSSEGGSSGNVAAGRGLEVRRMPVAVGTEEATSSFRLEFISYNGRNIGSGSKNHKRGFEIGNDVVEVERASSRASDEDDNGMSRKKLRLSKEQSAYLEETFKEHNTLNPQKQKLALAERLNLRPRQVEVWFQNRRARTKLKQTEVDYEYLKRCCETLTDENKRLHKELQELRALKTTSNPFYMQRPATTLTMCPSCERVATTSNVVPTSPSTKQAVEQNSKKTRSLIFPVSNVEPSSNSQQQHATQ